MLIREPEWSRVAARAVRPLLGQRQSRAQPDREKHPRASGAPPEDHNPRIFGPWSAQSRAATTNANLASNYSWPVRVSGPGSSVSHACWRSYLQIVSHADLGGSRIRAAHNYEFHYYFTENYSMISIFHTTHHIKVSDNVLSSVFVLITRSL